MEKTGTAFIHPHHPPIKGVHMINVIADDPLSAVANGTGLVLNELAFLLKDLTGNPK